MSCYVCAGLGQACSTGVNRHIPIVISEITGLRYIILLLRGPRAPYFEGSNIIEFLERYKELYEDYNLRLTDIVKRVPRYYKTTIS